MSHLHPERHYDLSAILGLAEPLPNIVWPKVELANNQFLIAYRGEAPSQVLPNANTKQIYVWEKLPTFPWWKEGAGSRFLAKSRSRCQVQEEWLSQKKDALCQKQGGAMTPFVINVMVRLAHQAVSGELIGGWTLSPELAYSGHSAYLRWGGTRLYCDYDWDDDADPGLFTSSCERLSGLEQ